MTDGTLDYGIYVERDRGLEPRAVSRESIDMKNMLLISIVELGILGSLAACGGGDSAASCGNTSPCGGNIVGAWTITSSCVSGSASMFSDSCPTATTSASNLKATGDVTYGADMTYVANMTISGTVSVTLPASCLTTNGITLTCAQLTQALAADPSAPKGTCANAGSGCACTVTVDAESSMETGTYSTTAAGILTETASGGTADESDYCVKGSTLTVSPHQGSGMMGQQASGSLTLTKH